MINIPITKLLFLDIETVGVQPDWKSLEENRPELAFQFQNYHDWFQKDFLRTPTNLLVICLLTERR